MEQHYDDTFLARWLNNELSKAETDSFQKSEYYKQYSEIIDTINTAKYPDYDTDISFENTLKKIKLQSNSELVTLKKKNYNWIYAVAASLLLFLGYAFFFQQTQHITQIAEQTTIELPDESLVELNVDSKLSFKSFNWENNRELTLNGEAFFKVKKGQTFTVKTSEGRVTVLGTQFTVNSRPNYYNVICFKGKVSVEITGKPPVILTKGEAISIQSNITKNYKISTKTPDWLSKTSTFHDVAILEVINELERQYNITVKGKTHLKTSFFSGRFSHTNLEQAVKTIFVAMEIPYIINTDGSVIIQHY